MKNGKILNYKCSIKFPHTLSFALLGKTKRKTKKKKSNKKNNHNKKKGMNKAHVFFNGS